ncbi:unnamed protein product [Prunus brigantina]
MHSQKEAYFLRLQLLLVRDNSDNDFLVFPPSKLRLSFICLEF